MSISSICDFLLEGSFIGFSISYLIIQIALLFNKENKLCIKYCNYSIKIIPYIGILFFIYFLYLLIKNIDGLATIYDEKEKIRTYFFLFRYVILVILTQLFWFNKIKKSTLIKNVIVLLILLLALFSTNIIASVLAYYYSYESYTTYNNTTVDKITIYTNTLIIAFTFLYKRITLFVILVSIVWFFNEKVLKLNNNKNREL